VIVECKKCGAPLNVERGSAFAKCGYCGTANKVKSARTLMAERPIGWQPPPVWTPPPNAPAPSHTALPYRPAAHKARTGRGCGVVLIPLIVLSIAGAVLFFSGALSEFGLSGIDETGEPELGTLDLDQVGSGLPSFDGEASGMWNLNGLGTNCRGYVSRAPDLLLRSSARIAVQLDVQTSTDLVMAVLTADGEWLCDDDSGRGFAPAISAGLGAGDHRVWVGTYSNNTSGSYTLSVSAQPAGAEVTQEGLAVHAPPELGLVQLGERPVRGIWDGTTSPWVEARTLGAGCRGHVPVSPHLQIDATSQRAIRIETTESTADLVLVSRTPSGLYICDDDSGTGTNARLEITPEIGRTAVWVGTYSASGPANFSLEVSEPTGRPTRGPVIAPSETPALGHVNLDVAGWTPVHNGTTRPELDSRTLAPDCRGWVGVAPDLVVLTTIPRAMAITTSSRSDLTLIVRGPDGSFVCDDDSGEQNSPRVHRNWNGGAHQVWVGSIHRDRAPYQLIVSETPL